MTDTFFDLQRFAVLVGGQSSFIWQDGETFGPAGTSAAVGTSSNPAYLVAKDGVAEAGTGTDVYLSGEKSYSFSLDGKDGWSAKLGKDNVAHVTNGEDGIALAGLTGSDAAVLTINGEFAEDFAADVTTTAEAKASLTADGTLTFGKAVEGATINLGAGEIAVLNKGGKDVIINNGAFNGIDITKKATLTSPDGTVAQIVTGNNSITMSNGNIVDVKADKDTNATIGSDQVIDGAKGVTVKGTAGFTVPTTVNGTAWTEISGGLSSIAFDSVGSATVENTGAVVVNGQDGAAATVQNLDAAGATVNGVKVVTDAEAPVAVGFALETLEGGGVAEIDVSTALAENVVVTGDQVFGVKAGRTDYTVVTDANSVSFNATGSLVNVAVEKDKAYNVDGGNARFNFGENASSASLNGAAVTVGAGEGIIATASDANEGIDAISNLAVGQKVSVANDSDGFTASFNAVEGTGEVVFEVNNASIRAAGIEGQQVQISVNGAGTEALVRGMNSTSQVSVGGTGITYHFKDAADDNAVAASVGEAFYVSLDSEGGIADSMDDANYKKLVENDQGKWDNVASIGNDQYMPDAQGDTVPANRSDVYNQFYNLDTSDAGQATLAVFANEDATTFDTVANPNGITFTGGRNSSIPLAENGHITLTAGSAVGAAPINIQRNESAAVVDVVVNLQNSNVPSTVAIGTIEDADNGPVTASHTIFLSNTGTGFVNVGEYATGQNQIFAGTGGAQIRHDGERATIVGNTGIDTIWAGKYDIVSGGAGGDQFYDSADYTITDYSAAQGDALIATRLHSIEEINKDNIKYDYNAGNEVSFGSSRNSFTIGQDQNAALNLNVAIMDTDARIVGSRNVVLAGANGGAADASGLTAGALIIADDSRNGNSGDAVVGSAYADEIYIGANDAVNAGAGNDYITIGSISATSGDAGATVFMGAGKNTVSGWSFGFDQNAGNTRLVAEEGYVGSFDNDRLLVTDANGSMLFDDSAKTSYHGEYNVIVNDTKYMAIRTNDVNNTNPVSYGDVTSNAELADVYIAEREGILMFGSGVTENLGTVDLTSTKYRDITSLALGNNSKAVVLGSDNRETVALGGDAAAGANKYVDLGGGNDVIISGGDDSVSAGHALFFGEGDGRDTIRSFSHYLGIDADPDKEYADILVLDNYEGLYTGTGEDGGARIEFVTGDDSRVFLYEDAGISTDKIYQIRVNAETKLTKIGNSSGSNTFAYSDKVDYYVGSSAENAADTLTVGNEVANANIWLDGSGGDATAFNDEYYRGIAVVDAGAETNTTVALVGNSRNNTLIAGGAGTYNSLWGGSGNNELIGSTAGQDTFFYVRYAGANLYGLYDHDETAFGGDDQIYNYEADNGDLVFLGDSALSDIVSTKIDDNAVTLEFNTGGSLTVNGTSNVRFALNGGTEYYVTNKETQTLNRESEA